MPLYVQKKGSEHSSRLVRRFCLKMKKSGILREARSRQYFQRQLSSQMKKRATLRRLQQRKEYERKKKLGKL